MKKAVFLLYITLQALTLQAQQIVNLNSSYKPNTIYNQSSDQTITIAVTYDGMEPMAQSATSRMQNIIKTGKLAGDTMPLTMDAKFEGDNAQAGVPDNLKVYGKAKLNTFPTLDSIGGNAVGAHTKEEMLNMMKALVEQTKLPVKTVKVGESFTDVTPYNLPMGQGLDLEMKITSTYKLTKIEGRKAYFDLKQVYAMDTAIQGSTIKGTGTGSGLVVFDMDSSYPVQHDSLADMSVTLNNNGLGMVIKITTDQKIATSVAANK